MIRKARWEERPQIEALWQLCFPEDSESFVQMFFDRLFDPDHTLVDVEDGRVHAALQLIPYMLDWFGRTLPVRAVSGVSTHPDSRKQGRAGRLMREALKQMHEEGTEVSFLYPFRASFYEPFGYASAYMRQVSTVRQTDAQPMMQVRPALDRITAQYAAYMAQRSAGIVRDADAMQFRMDDLTGDGAVLRTYDAGYAVTEQEGDTVRVLEQAGDPERLAAALLRDTQAEKLILTDAVAVTGAEVTAEAGNMLRLVDMPGALTGLPVRAMDCCVALEDADCPWNSGCWHFYAVDGRLQVEPCAEGVPMTPQQLVQQVVCWLDTLPMLCFETY